MVQLEMFLIMRNLKMKYVLYKNNLFNGMNKHDARREAKQLVKFTHILDRIMKRRGVSNHNELSEEDIERCRFMTGVKN